VSVGAGDLLPLRRPCWFQRIEHEGWTCYSEIWPPAGAPRLLAASRAHRFQSGPRTLYAGRRTRGSSVRRAATWSSSRPSAWKWIAFRGARSTASRSWLNGVNYYRPPRRVLPRAAGRPLRSSPTRLTAREPVASAPNSGSVMAGSLSTPRWPTQPYVPGSAVLRRCLSVPPPYLAPSVSTTSPTPNYDPAAPFRRCAERFRPRPALLRRARPRCVRAALESSSIL
jgi:hypothetical protein